MAFFCNNAGKTVTIQEDDDHSWEGIVISEIDIEQTHRNIPYTSQGCDPGETGGYNLSFSFEGTEVTP